MRLRIALIAASLDILGGQGVQARALNECLTNEGCDVTFIPINPTFPSAVQWIRRFPGVRTVLNETLYFPSLSRLRHVDIVHIFSASYWSFVLSPVPAILAALSFGKPTVLHYHSGEAEDHLARWGVLVHPWLRLADTIVVPSEYLRLVFARHGYNVHVVRNVIDTSRFSFRSRSEFAPRLLSSRNLDPYYRVDNTIRAFALLKSRYPEATLTVAGDGSQKASLHRLAASLGTDGIRFVGRVEPEAMPELHEHADIFVNSSTLDNQPVSVLEAFASGLPVVSTATGDLAALVRDHETGLIVPPDDPAAMAAAVTTLLERQEFARALARNARRHVETYSWPRVRDQWAAVYAGVCR